MLKLLIVDDSKWVREGLTSVIDWSALQIEVLATCANAAKACEILMSHPVDIVLTDIKMVGMDGLELAEFIHTHYPRIRIILISAYKEFDYAYKAVQLGVAGYVLKPIVPEDLIKVIKPVAQALSSAPAPAEPEPAPAVHESGETSSSRKNIASAIQYINRHISDKDLSLRQVADDLHINYYYLSKCFKDSEGVSFTEYVAGRRMQIASNLLTATSLHVYEICTQIGLDPKNFHSLFRRYYSMTPQEYRRSHCAGKK